MAGNVASEASLMTGYPELWEWIGVSTLKKDIGVVRWILTLEPSPSPNHWSSNIPTNGTVKEAGHLLFPDAIDSFSSCKGFSPPTWPTSGRSFVDCDCVGNERLSTFPSTIWLSLSLNASCTLVGWGRAAKVPAARALQHCSFSTIVSTYFPMKFWF